MEAVHVAQVGAAFEGKPSGGRPAGCDPDSRRWLRELRDRGPVGDRAVQRLHGQLLRMAYRKLLSWHPPPPHGELDDVAISVADDAVVAVLAHLDDFRGASLFTTWAYQFALTEVSAAMRKRRRHLREVSADPSVIVILAGARADIERQVEETELLHCVCAAVNDLLSAYQRTVLRTVAIDGETPCSTALAFDTNVGAIYKSLHDARRKLRIHLRTIGFAMNDARPAGH